MKKTIVFLMLVCIGVTGVVNAVAQSRLPNPERGFRYEAMAKIPSLRFPWDSTRKMNTATWLKDLESVHGATDQHIRLSQLYLYFSDFANTDTLSVAALDSVSAVFNGVRAQGYKVVLRLAYTYDGPGGYVYPPMTRILKHLDQLTPLLRQNIDIIHVMQTGIIGMWAEWHNYNNAYSAADKTTLVQKILTILPQGRHTQLRLPEYKNDANLTVAEDARVGYANDFFTDDQHMRAFDWGFWAGPVYSQAAQESKHILVDGEMPYNQPIGHYTDNENYLNYVSDPIKSIQQLKDHHYTSFSVAHNYDLTIQSWKSSTLSKSQMDANGFPYDPAYFNSGSRTVYDYVADHLGYRLWTDYSATSVLENDSIINCSVAIRNYGFSAIQNPREVFLVLLKGDGTLADTVKLTNKPSDWHTGETQTLSAVFTKPAGLGAYKIGIWMPDFKGSATRHDARYAMRFSNLSWQTKGIGGSDSLGINLLHLDSVRRGYCAVSGDNDPANRFIQTLSTANALNNISFTNSSFPADGYKNYISEKINVLKGSSFNLSMTNSPETKWSRVAVWVDWNNDGDFSDAGELIIQRGAAATDNSATVLSFTETVNVPSSAASGTVGMRVRLFDAWLPNPGACGFSDNSGNFDFYLDISADTLVQYCAAPGDTDPADRYIQSLTTTGALQNISYAASGYPAGGYVNFKANRVVAEQGSSFTLNMTNTANTKWSRVIAWIDWNRDGIFDDATERAFYLGSAASDNSATVLSISRSIAVPGTAVPGVTGMRIRFHDAWLPTASPCGYEDNGTVFDFQIETVEEGAESLLEELPKAANPKTGKNLVTLYPNPTANTLFVRSAKDIRTLRIVNLNGQELIRQQPGGRTETRVDVSKLRKGIYIVEVVLRDGNQTSQRFIKP